MAEIQVGDKVKVRRQWVKGEVYRIKDGLYSVDCADTHIRHVPRCDIRTLDEATTEEARLEELNRQLVEVAQHALDMLVEATEIRHTGGWTTAEGDIHDLVCRLGTVLERIPPKEA